MVKQLSDIPIEHMEDDGFGRTTYVRQLAGLLKSGKIGSGYAIGLCAPWGYGKTSVLRMLRDEIREDVILVNFNPWIYSDYCTMARELYLQIASRICAEHKDERKFLYRLPLIGEKIRQKTNDGVLTLRGEFGEAFVEYANVVLKIGTTVSGLPLASATPIVARTIRKYDSAENIKQRLEKRLEAIKKPVVVFIDDLDRLDDEEVFQILKTIKMVTNFKKVAYVVAFDDIVVERALAKRFRSGGGDDSAAGRKYLEKIFQAIVTLPMLEREDLDTLLTNELGHLIASANLSFSDADAERFSRIYRRFISNKIDTPRVIKRYINSLQLAINTAVNEVNLVDLIAVEFIRLLYPKQYYKLRCEKNLLTASPQLGAQLKDDERKRRQKYVKSNLADNDEDLLGLLSELFPAVKKLVNESPVSIVPSDTIPKTIGSPDYFDRYFVFGVGNNDISDTAVLDALGESGDSVEAKIKNLFASGKDVLVIKKIRANIEQCASPQEVAKSIMSSLDDMEDDQRNTLIISPREAATELAVEIALHSDIEQRLNIIISLVNDCNNLDYLVYTLKSVEMLNEKRAETEPIFTKEELHKYQEAVVEKIRKESKSHLLHDTPYKNSRILYQYWAKYGSRRETEAYIEDNLTSADEVLDFLTKFLAIWHSTNGASWGDIDNATYAVIKDVANVDKLYELLTDEYPGYAEKSEFISFRHSNLGKMGQEITPQFRENLAKQFMYQYKTNK